MNPLKYLRAARVPEELHAEALASLALAKERSKGLLAHKLKVRYLRAGKIAKLLAWSDERLCTVRPDLADWDVAPMTNITAHGDNAPWVATPSGARPVPCRWMDTDPQSDEYKAAVAANYWSPEVHPRSTKSRKAWYRRNGGEYLAWQRGVQIDEAAQLQVWEAEGVRVTRADGAWMLIVERRLLGPLHTKTRIGFEVDNVFSRTGERAWFPIDGHDLRAPATFSVRPAWKK